MGQCQGKRKKTTQEKSTTNNERTAGATDVVVVEERVEVCEVITDLESYNINVECTDLANYCLPLIEVRFSGQTTAEGHVSLIISGVVAKSLLFWPLDWLEIPSSRD